MKILKGFMGAFATSLLVALVTGLIFVIKGSGEGLKFCENLILLRKDEWIALLYVDVVALIPASIISLGVIIFIGIPMIYFGHKLKSAESDIILGFIISCALHSIIFLANPALDFFAAGDYSYAIWAIYIAGPLATYTFWKTSRPSQFPPSPSSSSTL